MKTCTVCSGPAPAASRCTNGCCARCHTQYCTAGGATTPGHNLKVFAVVGPAGNRVLVQAGTVGFFDCEPEVWAARRLAQTGAETAAALAGSLFGWNCPGARPESYTDAGAALTTRNRR